MQECNIVNIRDDVIIGIANCGNGSVRRPNLEGSGRVVPIAILSVDRHGRRDRSLTGPMEGVRLDVGLEDCYFAATG